jgi:iron complex outermembrane receptor protein
MDFWGYNNSYENTGSRNNKLMDLYLNYNKKWSLSILSLKLLRYSYQDFRDIVTVFSYNFENDITVDGVPVPSRVNLQSFCKDKYLYCDKYLLTLSYDETGLLDLQKQTVGLIPAVALA